MRVSCLNCARKHLACATILMTESVLGYPDHKWLAIGHMAQAEAELVKDYLHLALMVREARKVYEDDGDVGIMGLIRILGEAAAKR